LIACHLSNVRRNTTQSFALNQNVCFSNDSPKPLVALFGIMAFCTQNFIIISKNLILQNA